MTEIPVDTFTVRLSVCSLPRADHHVHVEGFPLPRWQLIPCERAGKIQEDTQDLSCWDLTFLTLDGTPGANIVEASCLLLPMLSS